MNKTSLLVISLLLANSQAIRKNKIAGNNYF